MQSLSSHERIVLAIACLAIVGGVAWRGADRAAPPMILHAEPAAFPTLAVRGPALDGGGTNVSGDDAPRPKRRRARRARADHQPAIDGEAPPRARSMSERDVRAAERSAADDERPRRRAGGKRDRRRRVVDMVSPFILPSAGER